MVQSLWKNAGLDAKCGMQPDGCRIYLSGKEEEFIGLVTKVIEKSRCRKKNLKIFPLLMLLIY